MNKSKKNLNQEKRKKRKEEIALFQYLAMMYKACMIPSKESLTWNVAKKCQPNVNQQVNPTSPLRKHTQWWKQDSQDDLADV